MQHAKDPERVDERLAKLLEVERRLEARVRAAEEAARARVEAARDAARRGADERAARIDAEAAEEERADVERQARDLAAIAAEARDRAARFDQVSGERVDALARRVIEAVVFGHTGGGRP